MTTTTKDIGRNGVFRLLDDVGSEGCVETLYLPPGAPGRDLAEFGLVEAVVGDTGAAVFVGTDRTIVIRPPLTLETDLRSAGCETAPLRGLLNSEPVIGVVLLRLGRYAIGVLRGRTLVATKTDSRYMKNRHRAGGQSQRRFERSRERLIREQYDKTCELTQSVFGPHLREMSWVMLGGERGTLNGFIGRCRLMRDLEDRTLSRRLSVDRPNQRALEGISYQVWKSRVTFVEK